MSNQRGKLSIPVTPNHSKLLDGLQYLVPHCFHPFDLSLSEVGGDWSGLVTKVKIDV